MSNALDLIVEVARRCPMGQLPANYVVLDLETNGFEVGAEPPVQWGLVVVKNNVLIDRFSFIVKVPPGTVLNEQAFSVHGIGEERIAREGVDPAIAVPIMSSVLRQAQDAGASFIGHNISRFDKAHIEYETARYGAPFKFSASSIVDTGALVKAAQIEQLRPDRMENLEEFFIRVHGYKKYGVKWALYPYCYDLFQLGRFNCPVGAHDAGIDCEMTHWVYQTIKDTRFGGPCALRS